MGCEGGGREELQPPYFLHVRPSASGPVLLLLAALSRSGSVANPFCGRSSGRMGRLLQAAARRVSVGLKQLGVRRCYGRYAPLLNPVASPVRVSCGSGRLLRRLPEADVTPATAEIQPRARSSILRWPFSSAAKPRSN
ncbi:hypothetical protein NDU88_003523 [Pleurodeles waltl]|uniref:Secreted protein n=1 Tax=Pleurodeles waltl TaxID=8319 RepID=A0AAV7VGC2_PLEWA|nr:hypothetical protein NDU88_003523 [Pleurodeles waltl]